MLNDSAYRLFEQTVNGSAALHCDVATVGGTPILDAGVGARGSIEAGIVLARLCLGDGAAVSLCPAEMASLASLNAIFVRTDHPLRACLGAQYAGWPVQTDDFFAMGSGPMRMRRGREKILDELKLTETSTHAVGVLECDRSPSESALALIGEQCAVSRDKIRLAIAPSTSIAGSIQVVARSIETALHKLHELGFDVRSVVSGTGHAPLPPPARPGDIVGGIGRTNDAILYGATVCLWVDHDDAAIEETIDRATSDSSDDHGQPFAQVFKKYDYDFYRVDPLLFSPAVLSIHNLRSGRTWSHGKIEPDILRESFYR